MARLWQPRAQLAVLGGVLLAVVLAIIFTDLAVGGDTESPEELGSTIEVTPGTRVVILPTLAPIEVPEPAAVATRALSGASDALARDAQRLEDLALLQAALSEYRDRFDEYPDTGGSVQTICAYSELDKGCDLKKVLDDEEEGSLEDPLGEPVGNGYWYASDGQTYSIWMIREGPGNAGDPVCPEVIPHLEKVGPLFCVTGVAASS